MVESNEWRGEMPVLECEMCGEEQEQSILGDSELACPNCGSKSLTQQNK